MRIFPVTNQNQHDVTNAHPSNTIDAPLYTKPTIIMPTSQEPTVAKHEDGITNLTRQILELYVKVMKRAPRRPQPTNKRTNTWCNDCTGHGHVAKNARRHEDQMHMLWG